MSFTKTDTTPGQFDISMGTGFILAGGALLYTKTEEDTGSNPLLDDVIRQRLGSLKPLDFSVQRRGSSEEDITPDTSTHPDHGDMGAEAGGGTEDRRRQRNREASRRYRERARTNPDLLRRMREQQNARQKKYYARLRQRKQSSTSSLV